MTAFEAEILFLLESYAAMSTCKDKHVAAVSVLGNDIVGISKNRPIQCNGKCDHTCNPMHAEQGLNCSTGCTVYINLYPCPECQRYLRGLFVKEIVVYGTQHKEDIGVLPIRMINVPFDYLKKFNTIQEQRCVAAGECAELIHACMDSLRTDKKPTYREIPAEMVDVFIQLFLLKEEIGTEWHDKIELLNKKFAEGGFDMTKRLRKTGTGISGGYNHDDKEEQ